MSEHDFAGVFGVLLQVAVWYYGARSWHRDFGERAPLALQVMSAFAIVLIVLIYWA
jgi:hypothetical protein